MKCPSCSTENKDGAKFCKQCGAALGEGFKTCPNGHNYESSLSECPYCPKPEQSDSDATVMENGGDKTVIDNSPPELKKEKQTSSAPAKDPDRTVIFSTQQDGEVQPEEQQSVRKLVGWLVTFDLAPEGKDFRLTEGRFKIGKNQRNDIVLTSEGISDEHAVILYRGGKFLIQDQLSTNGTFLNGELLEDKAVLKENDVIRLGNINLTLKIL